MSLHFDTIREVQSPQILHAWINTGVQEWTRLHDGQRGSRATTVGWRAWFAKQFPHDVESMRALCGWIVESAGLLPVKGRVVLPSENHMVDIAITLVQHERELGPAGLVTREGVLRGVQTQIRTQCLRRNPIMEAVEALEGELVDEAYWTIRLKEHRERPDISHVARPPAPGRPARPVDPELVQLFSHWATALRILCGPRSQDELAAIPDAETDAVTDIVTDMRAVKPSLYNTPRFFDALAASDLPLLIGELTGPTAFLTHQHHQAVQQRLLCISDQLSALLVQWTPKAIAEGWAALDTNYRSPDENAHTYRKLTPANFIKLLRRFEGLLPRGETPTCVFMLYAYLPFRDSWNRWTAAAIDTIPSIPGLLPWERSEYRYNVNMSEQELQDFYSQLIAHLGKNLERMSIQESQPWLYEIFKRTLEARKLRKDIQTHGFKNSRRREGKRTSHTLKYDDEKPESSTWCLSCAGLPTNQQCVQHRVFTRRSYPYVNKRGETIDSVLGCGISKAPLHDRMRPAKLDLSAPIYHPEHDLDLEPIRSDSKILERCGRMIVYIYDSEENESSRKPLFFVAFGAIPEDILPDLDRHGENIALTVPKLKRGKALEVYGFGEMRARGARLPMGGTRGDGYAAYRSTDALTIDGIRAQFDHAENATIYMEIARSIDPDLVREIEAQSRACERLGQFGANLYSCRNYCAPQHVDRDACTSICSQEAWMGNREYDEWGFAQPEFGFFIATETNTLWSFNSNYVHGTILPCRSTLEEITVKRGGAQAYSRGKHSTTQTKNRNRAEEYLRARQTWNARTEWWQEQCSAMAL